MLQGLTESEKFVTSISERAFLKLWTHPNPIGKKGKELCDCLIVCENHIIIISVKDIQYKAVSLICLILIQEVLAEFKTEPTWSCLSA